MMNDSGKDKRKSTRQVINIPVQIRIGDTIRQEVLHDISLGGLAFKSEVEIKKDTVISVQIPHINAHVSLKGKVIWSKKDNESYAVGIEFSPMNSDEARLHLIILSMHQSAE
jgi:hypothetical protein